MRAILTGALGIGLACCFAVAQQPTPQTVATEKAAAEQEAKVYPVTYRVEDIPVWSHDGAFDPTLLMALIQSSVNPESWEASGGPSTMAPYAKTASLVVSTTSDNHDELKSLLERLRR